MTALSGQLWLFPGGPSFPLGPQGGFGAGTHIQLIIDVGQVGFHRPNAQAKLAGDLEIG